MKKNISLLGFMVGLFFICGILKSQEKFIWDIKPPFTFSINTVTPEGKPVSGVKVHCRHPQNPLLPAVVDMVVESDSEGVAKFVITQADLKSDERFAFEIADPRYITNLSGANLSPFDEFRTPTFKVMPISKNQYSLKVVNQENEPLSNATIYLVSGEDLRPFRERYDGRTNNQGIAGFEFPECTVNIIARAPGYAGCRIDQVSLKPEEPYVIRLEKGRGITGQIFDQAGLPMSGVQVIASAKGTFLPRGEGFYLKAVTDKQGEFFLDGAAEGEWYIEARSVDPDRPDYFPSAVVEVLKDSPVKRVEIKAQKGYRLKGRIITRHPIELRHNLQIYSLGDARLFRGEWSDEEGNFDIWGLPCDMITQIQCWGRTGYYNYFKLPENYSDFEVTGNVLFCKNIAPGVYDNIEIHYLRAGMINGHIMDPLGIPLDGFHIETRPDDSFNEYFPSEQGPVIDLGGSWPVRDGRFNMKNVPPLNEVRLVIMTNRQGTISKAFETEPFQVKEGQIVDKDIIIRDGNYVSNWPKLAGRKMPDFKYAGISIEPEPMENKMILLCFWDMDQRPSRHYVEQLNQKLDLLKQQGVYTLGIHLGSLEQKALDDWMRQNKITLPVVINKAPYEEARFIWRAQSLPWLILTDKNHVVRAEGFGLDEVEEKIKEIIR